jgi:hypothetical protein
MRDLLGGKGAKVAEMTRTLDPERVPAGFTITTGACVAYMDGEKFPVGPDIRRRRWRGSRSLPASGSAIHQTRSTSSTTRALTTSPAPAIEFPWREWRPPRPQSAPSSLKVIV